MTLDVPLIINSVKELGDSSASKYLESEHRSFAIYSLQSRAIPYFNGMKPVQQRCLWQLRSVTKYEKVAKLTGQVMAIHPHGDCLEYNTEILLANGTYITIGDWIENHPNSELLIRSYDRETEEYVDSIASPSVGKIVNELIEIEFDNGAVIKSSVDHQFLLDDGHTYVNAEDLTDKMAIKSF